MAVVGDQIIISGDAHFAEPPDVFESRLPIRLHDRAPKVVKTPAGEFWVVEHLEPAGIGGSTGAVYESLAEANKAGYAGTPKSIWDPAERLKEQDVDTVSAEVLYASWGMFLFSLDDDDLRAECFSAFNDWAGEYCSYAPNRLKGLGLCDVTDPATAVRHLEQIKSVGLSGALIASSPEDERPYFLDDYEPVWSAAEELELPLTMHILTGAKGKGSMKYSQTQPNGKPSPESRIHYVTRVVVEVQASLGHIIAAGVFDRHPDLKLVLAETDVGWLPHFIYRMDHFNGANGDTRDMQQQPTGHYFRNNIYATAQFETDTFRYVVEHLGADRFMWSTDYPHFDCAYPKDRELIGSILADGFSDEDAASVLHGTAAELYGIDVNALKVLAGV